MILQNFLWKCAGGKTSKLNSTDDVKTCVCGRVLRVSEPVLNYIANERARIEARKVVDLVEAV